MIADRRSRPPPPYGQMTSVGGTTRWKSTHNSSGTNRSARSVTRDSMSDHTIRNNPVVVRLCRPDSR